MVVDFSNVAYIDSSGLAILIEGMQNVEAYGGKLQYAGLQKWCGLFSRSSARLDQVLQGSFRCGSRIGGLK